MNTVLLVDDEPAVLDSLRAGILWENFGVDTLLSASGGEEALEKLEQFHVDLLITDIQMPYMDGITLLREVRTKYPHVRCVLLTAFAKFEYAREAIALGAENYLLKPFNREELEATIEKALDNIFATREISKDLFRNNILSRWADSTIRTAELSERSSLLGINIYLPEYCIVCAYRKQPGSLSLYLNRCFEALSEHYEVQRFSDKNHHRIFIIGGNDLQPEEILQVYTSFAPAYAVESLLALSIGPVVYEADALPQSYQEALRLINTADLSIPGMQIFTKDNVPALSNDLLVDELSNLFQETSEEKRRKGYEALSEKLFLSFEGEQHTPELSILAQNLRQLFCQEFPDQPELIRQLNDRIHLFSAVSPEIFQTAACELLEYSYLLFSYSLNRFTPIIDQSIRYIHQHYAENISINDFCIKVKTNSAYFGNLFRKETGIFFNNYLTQYRISRSIQLLLNTEMKINDIANQVGFSSVTYFLTSFKKKAGMSPAKYRIYNCDHADFDS